MSTIYINGGKKQIEGEFSFSVGYDIKAKPPVMEITGVLSTTEILDDIYAIENGRYFLDDVVVTNESYGSEEDTIMYYFMAGKYLNNRKGSSGDTNGK